MLLSRTVGVYPVKDNWELAPKLPLSIITVVQMIALFID